MRTHPFVEIDCLGMRSDCLQQKKEKALKYIDFKALPNCWAVFVCILFSLAGDRENRIKVFTSVRAGERTAHRAVRYTFESAQYHHM